MWAFYQFSTPSEFWLICPVEAAALVEARSRQRITMTWQQAAMNRWAKTKSFPASPEGLLRPAQPQSMTNEQMAAAGLEIFGQLHGKHR